MNFICSRIPRYTYLSCLLQLSRPVTVSQNFLVFWWLSHFRGLLSKCFVDCPSAGITGCFSRGQTRSVDVGEARREEVLFSSHINGAYYQYDCWYWPWTVGWGSACWFLACEVTSAPFSILCSLEISCYEQPTLGEWGATRYQLCVWRCVYTNFSRFFCMGCPVSPFIYLLSSFM